MPYTNRGIHQPRAAPQELLYRMYIYVLVHRFQRSDSRDRNPLEENRCGSKRSGQRQPAS
ncbi:uncharacterized protein BO66DRAFT_392361 [Aspergillus aculeatinus CBS 121060]|uniref:Uncharacterized protein n=2 Tax=Aspergillus aculeatinus CBS 121060 TaxID=1448322 RepID=A0ACD1H876_9EURO|nr:hypothetical protein BO66DRAFT_392349 [Aspergillus aculeatinus CBS 121060]XP_025503511.1 hypothetical protein BO66DRAFT_392361 [Aspergillus aculeatinus CBS 121060]RAH69676.1 hypothetical protein BO66DRAFT_392349 [Aspergillus aculeatinus CBS 121060]RAH69688.1 hypothetical protein BO66DRAFT_392361 [Aspergillus aculeatinus CBS 121060]